MVVALTVVDQALDVYLFVEIIWEMTKWICKVLFFNSCYEASCVFFWADILNHINTFKLCFKCLSLDLIIVPKVTHVHHFFNQF